ncbi:MAG: trypsin-like peptidase domain-containing protein [Candidatus Eisenbacteria bacterium]|nr:trypsin-like peptidase domain-containing protein [Candidatus Eisenbacteria bacterium]
MKPIALRALALIAACAAIAAPVRAQDKAQSVFHDARDYTVRIKAQLATPFLGDERGSWQGAGFLVDASRRWVITNAHVAAQSPANVQVAFAGEPFRPARRLYVDSFTDVAILELSEPVPHAAPAIDCDQPPEIGEGVGVFGHPYGMYFTGTRGIVSGKTNQIRNDLIQIDATLEPGNSGGPVISLRDGRIVGIATSMVNGQQKNEHVNFATPMKDVCRILDLLGRGIPPEPPLMEFSLLVDPDGRHTLEVGHTYDPARWPFQPGDRILAVGDEKVETLSNLVTALRGRTGTVTVRVLRAGHTMDLETRPVLRPSVVARRGISIDGALLAPAIFEDSPSLSEPARLMVQSVEPGSQAEALGIAPMDIVQSVDGRTIVDLDMLAAYLDHRHKVPLRIVLRRMSESSDRWFELLARDLAGDDVHKVGPAAAAGPDQMGAARPTDRAGH